MPKNELTCWKCWIKEPSSVKTCRVCGTPLMSWNDAVAAYRNNQIAGINSLASAVVPPGHYQGELCFERSEGEIINDVKIDGRNTT